MADKRRSQHLADQHLIDILFANTDPFLPRALFGEPCPLKDMERSLVRCEDIRLELFEAVSFRPVDSKHEHLSANAKTPVFGDNMEADIKYM